MKQCECKCGCKSMIGNEDVLCFDCGYLAKYAPREESKSKKRVDIKAILRDSKLKKALIDRVVKAARFFK
jgi:hypothetical protein